MLNRKAHVATWLVVLGALVLMVTAWYTFLTFNGSLDSRERALYESIKTVNSDSRYVSMLFPLLVNYTIKDALLGNFQQTFAEALVTRAGALEVLKPASTNLFQLLQDRNFTLVSNNGIYTLRVIGVSVESTGEDSIKRTLNLEANFTAQGIIS